MRELNFEGVSFNVDLNQKRTKKQFVEKSLRSGLYSHRPAAIQKQLIEEAYRLIKSFEKPKPNTER